MADNYLERHYADYERRKATLAGVSKKPSFSEVRAMRISVFNDTVECCSRGSYINKFGDTVTFPVTDGSADGTQFYTNKNACVISDIPTLTQGTEVSVINIDCLIAAKYLLDNGYKPAVLNMASRHNPGGGVINGSGAQEENLCRRTTLHRSIFPYGEFGAKYGLGSTTARYPMDHTHGGIYTPEVWVIKDEEDKRYQYLDTPYKISVITVAGVNNPDLDDNGLFTPQIAEAIRCKIRTIMRLGLKNGNDSLVLGALGCGAFRNPPEQVAVLFKEVFNEPEFKNKYRRIIFAILDDHNAHQAHNPHGNFKPFKEVFA
ncbi:MAG: TIGR02452 family protein [Paludibacteraceae bacterium]|nr:TIGR02452 family protein [Paludibacteraceae bacterium]